MRAFITFAAVALGALPLTAPASAAQANMARASAGRAADVAAVKKVLWAYKSAIERLDATGTERFFATQSTVFETGGAEGSYANYLAKHLGPELGKFKSFKFGDYKADVRFEGPIALATETYTYRIEPKEGEVAERIGVATSVLKKEQGKWKIVVMHNSARKPKAQ